ncbi:MAG: glutathione S-transferase family protein [Alphaproteobacteria bacterium]|nr:glutathione S-transferase family protein [Alphaproteobacteria bacterium]
MTISLYVFPPSPRSFKILALAEHLGLAHEVKLVDLAKGEQRAPEFFAINPNMRAPALRHGDYELWESGAILQYLALQKPEAGLLPLTDPARIDVTRWQFWDTAHWDPACATFIFEHVVKPFVLGQPGVDPAAIEKGTPIFHRIAKVLEHQLSRHRYIAGDQLSVADFSAAAPLVYAKIAQMPVGDYANIHRWSAEMMALPAWVAAADRYLPKLA